MAIIRLTSDELDKRILETAENGVYFNSLVEAFSPCGITKTDIKDSIRRLKQRKVLVSIGSQKHPELGTYYEQVHWLGEKPLLGPAHNFQDLSLVADLDRHYKLQAWQAVKDEVNLVKISMKALGRAALCLTVLLVVMGMFNSGIYRLALIAAPLGIGFWAGTSTSAREMKWIDAKVMHLEAREKS